MSKKHASQNPGNHVFEAFAIKPGCMEVNFTYDQPVASNDVKGRLRTAQGRVITYCRRTRARHAKTALTDALCKTMRDQYEVAGITNDIFTREDASMNLTAIDDMNLRFPVLELVFFESGGDNSAATFSPKLADITLYVIDVSAGDKIPRKGGPGITRSDLLIINKTDLAPLVGADLGVMDRNAKKMRGDRPFCFTNLKAGDGVAEIAAFITNLGGLPKCSEFGAVVT